MADPADRDSPRDSPRDSSSRTDAIQHARRVIGSGDANAEDWRIAPAGHAERYAGDAPALAARLRSSAIVVVAERFEALDGRAVEAQKTFNTVSSRARSAVFGAGIASAVLLAGGSLGGVWPDVSRWIILVGAVGAVVLGGAATMWLQQVKQGQLLERWMTARAEAESTRHHFFEKMTEPAGDVDPNILLEYFRRYQLDVQRAYYGGRGAQHRRAADRALQRSTLGVAGGSIATGFAGLGMTHPAWTSLAALGLAGQAWGARVANEEATAQDRRNAERYGRTRLSLDRVYERLDEVRAAVAGGHPGVLAEFVQAVHEQLSLEHRQWLEEMHGAGTAIGRLEELLSRYRDEPADAEPAGRATPPPPDA